MDATCCETSNILRTAKSCGPGAPRLALSERERSAHDGGNKAWSPGRSRISRKTIAQGMFWRKNINKNKGKGALYPPLCRDPLRPKIAVQNLRRATMHWLLASCLSSPQWLCFRASQGRALAHSRAERVPECTTGQTRTTGRPCASADDAQAAS